MTWEQILFYWLGIFLATSTASFIASMIILMTTDDVPYFIRELKRKRRYKRQEARENENEYS